MNTAACHADDIGPAAFAAASFEQERTTPARTQASLRCIIERTVADVFDIDCKFLRLPTRGQARIALARQVAMYVAHVSCGFSLTEVGAMFERDRTTVSHACEVVERRRDRGSFDHAIELIELVIRVMIGPNDLTCRSSERRIIPLS